MEGRVGEEEFKLDVLLNKGASGAVGGYGGDVLSGAGVSEEAGSRVLDVL